MSLTELEYRLTQSSLNLIALTYNDVPNRNTRLQAATLVHARLVRTVLAVLAHDLANS